MQVQIWRHNRLKVTATKSGSSCIKVKYKRKFMYCSEQLIYGLVLSVAYHNEKNEDQE